MNFFFSLRCGRTRLIATCLLEALEALALGAEHLGHAARLELLDDAVSLLAGISRHMTRDSAAERSRRRVHGRGDAQTAGSIRQVAREATDDQASCTLMRGSASVLVTVVHRAEQNAVFLRVASPVMTPAPASAAALFSDCSR